MARRTREETLETRERLLESAFDVMSEKPFSCVTMSEIAERVGLSKGAAYWHFKNKNDILIHLVRLLCTEVADSPGMEGGFSDTLGKIRLFYRNRMKRISQNERFEKINVLFQRKLEWPKEVHDEVFIILQDRIENEQRMTERLLVEAQEKGELRPDFSPREISSLIAAIFFGLFVLFGPNPLYPRGELDLTKYTDFIFDAFDKELSI